ncbi:UPF0182 family membrane protein [Kineococcus indalonis]|uniref:UPF0182 family membrane protein n=1 Tax=Kineococcus indalonis TaxID=2696566 RepID=UPI001412E190|nr:UPF0182 family protein [Kineococcus indalonis]NAZ85018.1 UPF0182 family protein [Kineococcus indalonis]
MSFPPRRPARPVLRRRRRGAALPTVLVLVALVVAVVVGARIATDVWWFDQLGFLRTFTTKLWLQAALFAVGALLLGGAVAASLTLGYRTRPVYAPISTEQAGLDRYRESLEPLRRLVVVVLSVAAGLFGGSVAMSRWETLLLWLNRTSFGTEDAQFGMDQGFYVFSLPWLSFVVSFLSAAVVLAGLAALATHYLYGGLRLAGGGQRTTREARVHLASLAALFLVLRGVGYWLDRYEIMVSESGNINIADVVGPSYTDVHAVLPAKAILAIVAVVVALLFVAAAAGTSWRLPAIGTGLLVVSAIAVGGVYPWAVQRFQVTPNRQALEAEYVDRNIRATRDAYDVADTETTDYQPDTSVSPGQLREDADTIPGVRLLDPNVVSDAFRQTQGQRNYYAFPDPLDVDRYSLDGQTQDTVIAARELNLEGLSDSQRTWVNLHTVYTHGYGVVAARGNERAPDGRPSYFEANIPSQGDLGDYEPRIYFGERTEDYSIAGGGDAVEIDYPDNSPEGYARTSYTGGGGVPVGGLLRKLVYALKFGDQNILLSNQVNADSRILYDRTPRERVEKVAPWLTLDGDAYPAVVDGKVLWILDGYTTSASYPYSSTTRLGEVTTDSLTTQTQSVQALQDRTVNYVRNSVKATVDAYTGAVTLYAWDDTDPVLMAWMKAFPDAVQPLSQVSGSLMSHLRYPQDMFKVQRDVLSRYHVTDPRSFLTGQDFWQVPQDPTASEVAQGQQRPAQPPYYLTLQMPGQPSPAFSLTTTYVPTSNNRGSSSQIITGFAAVDADAGSADGEKNEGYGTIRLLELPQSSVVAGPVQVQNDIQSNAAVAEQVRLLSLGQGSEVINGNLLTLPVGGGLLYVEPIYARSTGQNSFPQLRKVVAVFGDQIAIADTLNEALDDVFAGDSGATAGDEGAPPIGGAPAPTAGPAPGATGAPAPVAPVTGDPQAQLQAALTEARSAIQDSAAALARQDFTAYGQAQERLRAAVESASAAQAALAGASGAAPDPAATPSGAPTP